ncbi:putative flippase GtrA [Streptomyces sp. SLBN-31]|nr:putative flippase GtrA [Streptomyces sp. SLBN-31]
MAGLAKTTKYDGETYRMGALRTMEQGSSGLRRLTQEIAKFGAVGALGTVVNFGVSNLLWHVTSLQAVRANVIATVVAIGVNYLGFRYFTYRDRDKSARARELTLFLAFSLVGLVIENGVLYAAIYGFGWDSSLQRNIFKVVGIGLGTLFRFWSYRTWVFKALPAREAVADAEAFLEAEAQAASAQLGRRKARQRVG